MTFAQSYARSAAMLSDEALVSELQCTRRLAMQCTRSRRDLALLKLRCLDCELARRMGQGARDESGAAWGEQRA